MICLSIAPFRTLACYFPRLLYWMTVTASWGASLKQVVFSLIPSGTRPMNIVQKKRLTYRAETGSQCSNMRCHGNTESKLTETVDLIPQNKKTENRIPSQYWQENWNEIWGRSDEPNWPSSNTRLIQSGGSTYSKETNKLLKHSQWESIQSFSNQSCVHLPPLQAKCTIPKYGPLVISKNGCHKRT